jgi:sulfatase maturation enzyme AslB (radical SAM superfamily)
MPDNFCNYPFQHLSIGQNADLRPCCVGRAFKETVSDIKDLAYWWQNDNQYNELRQAHRRNEQDPACKTCWQQEASGFKSMRNYVTSDQRRVDPNNFKLESVEITGGRLCNLACKMCDPNSSNQIERESRPWTSWKPTGPVNWLDDAAEQDRLVELLLTPSIRSIYFTGGEPQLMPCYQQLLEKWSALRDLGQVNIHFNTNATVFNQAFWKQIRKFWKKQVDLSIDAVGEAYEQIRIGGTWNTTRKNALQIRDYMLQDDRPNIIYLTIVTQLSNVDQGAALQEFFDELRGENGLQTEYKVMLLPVNNNPEWSWTNTHPAILREERAKLTNKTGAVVEQFKTDLDIALANNQFHAVHADKVCEKETYFQSKFGRCLWDLHPDWKNIYKNVDN